MVIIRAKLPQEKGEIHNEMSLILERVSSSCKVIIDNLKFYTKSRSRSGLLSSVYLIVQRFFILELQANYLRCPYDIQEKISSHAQEKWFNEWYAACIDYYQNYSCDIWSLRVQTICFPNKSGVGGVSFPTHSISPNYPVNKA